MSTEGEVLGLAPHLGFPSPLLSLPVQTQSREKTPKNEGGHRAGGHWGAFRGSWGHWVVLGGPWQRCSTAPAEPEGPNTLIRRVNYCP